MDRARKNGVGLGWEKRSIWGQGGMGQEELLGTEGTLMGAGKVG